MEKLIQIKNLTKCFGETKVLDKIKLNFDTYNSLTPNWYYKVLR